MPPHKTKHAPKVSTRSVIPYARESSPKNVQQDRQTHRRIVQNDFSRRSDVCTVPTFQIRFYLKLDFLLDANTSAGHGRKMAAAPIPPTYKGCWAVFTISVCVSFVINDHTVFKLGLTAEGGRQRRDKVHPFKLTVWAKHSMVIHRK